MTMLFLRIKQSGTYISKDLISIRLVINNIKEKKSIWIGLNYPYIDSNNHFLPPLEPPVDGGLFPLPPPDLFPVVLGAFFNPLDFAIITELFVMPTSF
jgi:hypothetical protein